MIGFLRLAKSRTVKQEMFNGLIRVRRFTEITGITEITTEITEITTKFTKVWFNGVYCTTIYYY